MSDLREDLEAIAKSGEVGAKTSPVSAASKKSPKKNKGYGDSADDLSDLPEYLDLENILDYNDEAIRGDIIQLIAQYMNEEGYNASRTVFLDEACVKVLEKDEQNSVIKSIQRALLEGDWPEVDLLCRKNLKNHKCFLYKVYKEQYLEYIENQLYQKAYVHLIKRLKPLEHLQSTPEEFRDLCYLLTAKSLHEVPRFKSWQGSLASREELSNKFALMLSVEKFQQSNPPFVPPRRLLSLLRQSVAYQILSHRKNLKTPIKISTLLKDYAPPIIPNTVKRIFSGHTDRVKCVCLAGINNQNLLSGSGDKTCRAWDTDTGALLGTLNGHQAMVWDVASNNSSMIAASASADGTVKLWDLKRNTCIKTYNDSVGDVYSVAFSPDKKHLVCGSYDRTVRLYNLEREVVVKTFSGHLAAVTHTIFNLFGNLVVSCSKDTSIKFWDLMSGLCIREIPHFSQVTSSEFSDNGTTLLSSSKDNLNRIWDLRTTSALLRLKGHRNISKNHIKSSFMNPGLVCGGSEDGFVYLWDTTTGNIVQKLHFCDGSVYRPVWDSIRNILVACSDDVRLKAWHQL